MKNKLKDLRLQHGETHEDMANLLHLTLTDYAAKENGRIEITEEEKKHLAAHFNTSVDHISGYEDTLD